MLLTVYLEDCLLARQDIRSYNISTIVQVVVQAVGFLCLYLVLTHRQSLVAATASYASGVTLSFVVALVLVARHARLRLGWKLSLIRDMFGFGIKGYLTALLNLGNTRFDNLVLTVLTSVTAVGFYSVAQSVTELTWQLPLAVSVVLFPATAAISHQSGAEVSARVCRQVIFVEAICLVMIGIGARILVVFVFGPAYLPAVQALQLLLPGAVGYTVYKTLYSYMLGTGKPSIGIVSTGVSLTATVVLDILLIPRMGIEGAAITSSIAYCLNGCIILIAFTVVTRINPFKTLVVDPSDIAEVLHMLGQRAQLLRDRYIGAYHPRRG